MISPTIPSPQPTPHQRITPRTWILGIAAALATIGMASVLLMTAFFPDNNALAQRAAQALEDAVGSPVTIGALHWQLLPVPRVELLDVAIHQPRQSALPEAHKPPARPNAVRLPDPTASSGKVDAEQPRPGQAGVQPSADAGGTGGRTAGPIALQRVTLLPAISLANLWNRTVQLRRVEVDGANVPQRTLARLKNTMTPGSTPTSAAAPSFTLSPIPIEMLTWHRVVWKPHYGASFVLSGEATFDPQWRPRTAVLQLLEATTTTELNLSRTDPENAGQSANARWSVKSRIGGGTADGEITLVKAGNDLVLAGKLTSQSVQLVSALAAFNRQSVVQGKVSGNTAVSARAAQSAGLRALAANLETDTRFNMGAGELRRFDMGRAIRSAGTDTLGQTPLDSIIGRMTTRNTPDGMITRFVDVKARSGVLTVDGSGTVAQGRVNAELAVDIVDGVAGLPLRITGPTNKVTVSVPPAALAGAALGTAVLPGIGTIVGARLGSALGRLFGGNAAPVTTAKAPAAPVRGPRTP